MKLLNLIFYLNIFSIIHAATVPELLQNLQNLQQNLIQLQGQLSKLTGMEQLTFQAITLNQINDKIIQNLLPELNKKFLANTTLQFVPGPFPTSTQIGIILYRVTGKFNFDLIKEVIAKNAHVQNLLLILLYPQRADIRPDDRTMLNQILPFSVTAYYASFIGDNVSELRLMERERISPSTSQPITTQPAKSTGTITAELKLPVVKIGQLSDALINNIVNKIKSDKQINVPVVLQWTNRLPPSDLGIILYRIPEQFDSKQFEQLIKDNRQAKKILLIVLRPVSEHEPSTVTEIERALEDINKTRQIITLKTQILSPVDEFLFFRFSGNSILDVWH